MKQIYTILIFFTSLFSFAQLTPPAELQAYYANVDFTQTQLDLFDDLAIETISNHTNFLTYTPGVWEACRVTDEDPLNNANVLLIYGYNDSDGDHVTDRTRNKQLNGGNNGTDWNREHTFPRSLANPDLDSNGTDSAPNTDAHNLRPSDVQMNANRGNRKFGDGSGNASTVGSDWYPGDEWKGDAARIIMYMYLRYGTQCFPSYATTGTTNSIDPNMINLLLEWNAQDPVSTIEDNRNSYHANTSNTYAQGNRNPFIDNPFLATVIWGGAQAENRWGDNPPDDTQAPTVPTNLMASNETATSVDLTWTASTDDTGVTAYNVFVDNTYYISTNSPATSITVNGLSSETTYDFAVLAADLANNTSALSTSVDASTLEANTGGGDFCAIESFENLPDNSSSYSDRMWSGDDNTSQQWEATRARTDLSINSRAITIDVRDTSDGSITSPLLPNGVGSITVSTQRAFSGGTGTLDVSVNEVFVGTIPYGADAQTTTISDINFNGNMQILISKNTSSGDRVTIDDLSWTCYPSLSVADETLKQLKIYPNPVKTNTIYFNTGKTLDIKIYDILGKLVTSKTINNSNNYVDISNINKGIYLVKMTSGKETSVKKLIRN